MSAGQPGRVHGPFAHRGAVMVFTPAYHPQSDRGAIPCRCSVCAQDKDGAGVVVRAEGLPNYHWICGTCAEGIHDAARKAPVQ